MSMYTADLRVLLTSKSTWWSELKMIRQNSTEICLRYAKKRHYGWYALRYVLHLCTIIGLLKAASLTNNTMYPCLQNGCYFANNGWRCVWNLQLFAIHVSMPRFHSACSPCYHFCPMPYDGSDRMELKDLEYKDRVKQ